MSFLLPCPNCGPREVEEFRCAGEVTRRPRTAPTLRELTTYIYFRDNVAGVHTEWWYHRHGCELWFLAERDTRTNDVVRTWLPEAPAPAAAAADPAAVPEIPAT
jgi:heterotetrameric sarcosine oxidase delta subunit